MGKSSVLLLFLGITLMFLACKPNEEVLDQEDYEGPIVEAYNLDTKVSDSARIKLRIMGPRQLTFQTGDFEYPDGVFIEFYEPNGEISSTIKANRGYYIKKENVYRVEEDVEVVNIAKNQRLNTEELFWNPRKEEVYTDKFVNVTTETRSIKGVGLVADQDFSTYQISRIQDSHIFVEDEF